MSKLLVIADDFTGSNDTGVQLAKKGAKVAVSFSNKSIPCDVKVINTESRALSKEQAKQKVVEAIKQNTTPHLNMVFKKIDSTFRGNVGSEIEAAYEAFRTPLIVVVAAIPSNGRTTINGQCLVNGIPLLETEFAQDPKTPIHSSSIAEIIANQTTLTSQELGLDKVRRGKLASIFHQQLLSSEPKIMILDSENDDDLFSIATTLGQLTQPFILVGAAGIANQLPRRLFSHKDNPPVLILSGSMSISTQEQIDYSARQGLQVVDVDARNIWLDTEETLDKTITKALSHLSAGDSCAIRTVKDQSERVRSKLFCQQHSITVTEFSERVAHFLGLIAQKLWENTELSGVLFTGGDIAIAAAQALNADGYIIQGEVEPCIPYGHFADDTTKVVTKAGGFGTIHSIENSIQFLKGNS